MNSTRLPGKVLMPLQARYYTQPVLGYVHDAAYAAVGVDEVVVATTREERDDGIVEWCLSQHISTWRGSENNVLERFYDAAVAYNADAVVRLTGDCPLLDTYVIDEVIALFRRSGVDYANNTEPATYPDGLDVEVISMRALKTAHEQATLPSDRDTVCQWISRRQKDFPAYPLINGLPNCDIERWVLDTSDDYVFCQKILKELDGAIPSLPRILDILRHKPELREINAKWKRNERFLMEVAKQAGA